MVRRALPALLPPVTTWPSGDAGLIFAFQADNITSQRSARALIAVPILIQVYFNSGLDLRPDALVRVPYAWPRPAR